MLQSPVAPLFELLNSSIPEAANIELDTALYPNPFFGVANGTFPQSNQEFLGLTDGGEDGQVIPLLPLLVKARNVDVVLAIDAVSFSSLAL